MIKHTNSDFSESWLEIKEKVLGQLLNASELAVAKEPKETKKRRCPRGGRGDGGRGLGGRSAGLTDGPVNDDSGGHRSGRASATSPN